LVTRKIDWEHGTSGRYDQGCRCQPCKTANAEVSAKQRKVYRALAAVNPEMIPKHATLTSYAQWGCRCEECVTFAREYDRVRRAKARAARKAAMDQEFTFTARTIPDELVVILDADAGKVHSADGGVRTSLARILNAYEAWRHEQVMAREGTG
jgi:hypothetical protein